MKKFSLGALGSFIFPIPWDLGRHHLLSINMKTKSATGLLPKPKYIKKRIISMIITLRAIIFHLSKPGGHGILLQRKKKLIFTANSLASFFVSATIEWNNSSCQLNFRASREDILFTMKQNYSHIHLSHSAAVLLLKMVRFFLLLSSFFCRNRKFS